MDSEPFLALHYIGSILELGTAMGFPLMKEVDISSDGAGTWWSLDQEGEKTSGSIRKPVFLHVAWMLPSGAVPL